jgi:hypothetical protein
VKIGCFSQPIDYSNFVFDDILDSIRPAQKLQIYRRLQ